MKKTLFISVVMLSTLLAWGQKQLSISGLVQNSSLVGVSGQTIWVNLYSNGGFVSQQTVISNATGYYSYAVPAQPGATLEVMTNDCNGTFYSNTYTATVTDTAFDDTLRLACNGSPMLNCGGQLTQVTLSGNQVAFGDNSNSNIISNALVRRNWIFGDGSGTTTYNTDSTYHNYSAAGQYQVCMIKSVIDTTKKITYCADTTCLIFNISGSASFCNASFYPDSSTNGSLVIYNNSVPAHNNSSYTTSYSWDFGDGGTSAQPFPSHTYANIGLYEICLTITSIDASQNVCTNTFCDSLGMDTNGNILYKGTAAGFSLLVQSPGGAMVGVDEFFDSKVEVYPNPARDRVRVVWPAEEKYSHTLEWQIMDATGRCWLKGKADPGKEEFVNINVEPLTNGIYHLLLQSGKEISITKLMVN